MRSDDRVSFFKIFTKIIFSDPLCAVRGFGGGGPSPEVLKRLPQIFRRTGKLLGNLLKDFFVFRAVSAGTEKEQGEAATVSYFSKFIQKLFFVVFFVLTRV